jgi:all-trans-8'-apo-beta-carotenal 15,15'-oxygenase
VDINEVLTRGQPDTFATQVSEIEGTLPDGLDGVLFRNGAGTTEVGDERLCLLDGHGMVAAIEVADGKAFFRSAYTETEVRKEEVAAGRITRRRVFTNLNGWRKNLFNLNLGNSAAHDSYVWGDRVYATDLGGHYALSLPELKTEGKADWSSVVRRSEMVAPMPRDDLERGTLIAYALRREPKGDRLAFVEIDRDFGKVARTELVPIHGIVHDSAFTDDWYVTVETPATPNKLQVLLGRKPIWWAFEWRDEAPTLLLVPRGRPGDAVRVKVPDTLRTVFHIINAYDDGDEVVVDLIGYAGEVRFDSVMPAARGKAHRRLPATSFHRLRARPAASAVEATTFEGAQGDVPEVAPAVHGKKHQVAWYASTPSGNPEWDAGEGHHVSPPAFAPNEASDDPEDGWVLAWDLDLDSEKTDVVVLDAKDIAAGPVARLKLGVYLPATSHARFSPGTRVRS